MMNRNIRIKAEVVLGWYATKWLRFPITKPLRISIWLKNQDKPTASEFHFIKPPEIGVNIECEIIIAYTEFLDVIKRGDEFLFGQFSEPIGRGIVKERII